MGPSSSGKSSLVLGILEKQSELVDFPSTHKHFDSIIIVFKSGQPLYAELKQKVLRRFPKTKLTFLTADEAPSSDSLDPLLASSETPLLIFDDVGFEDSKKINALATSVFVRLSHHLSLSCIFITQTLFDQSSVKAGGLLRLLNRNAHFLILFKNPRDGVTLRILLQQYLGDKEKSRAVMKELKACLSPPHSYILFDFRQDVPDGLRLRGNILSEKPPHYPWILAFPEEITASTLSL